MFILIQLVASAEPYVLTRVLAPRCLRKIQSHLDDGPARLRDILSNHLTSINIHHRITVYETRSEPGMMFLRLSDPFPENQLSALVSILATQEITPPIPPKNFTFIGDF